MAERGNMKELIMNYWLEFTFGIIGSLLLFACKKLYAEINNTREGMKALLRSELIKDYNKYLEKGEMPIYAKENVEDIYKAYHNLGGNGVGTKMYNELMELPTEMKVHEHE
jgi:hypothetical protein